MKNSDIVLDGYYYKIDRSKDSGLKAVIDITDGKVTICDVDFSNMQETVTIDHFVNHFRSADKTQLS